MPIYEYECGKGHTFELMVSINGPDPKTCAVDGCRSKPKRMVSAAGFILKGNGWYATDYPSEARKQGLDADSKAANPDAGHTCGSTCSHGVKGDGGPTDESAPPPKALTEPIKKPKEKNPYSGSKRKKKAAKA
ncbi:MAG: zinc ribbon domain-containing protein [Nitrospina sp.]|nr:zinc ribbon domain-containing protein [Nitrospina sp.]